MLTLVTCYFNPAGFHKQFLNYQHFAASLARHHIPLITVELAFGQQPHVLTTPASTKQQHIFRLHGGSVLWQRERLIKYAVLHGNLSGTGFCWIDCDLLFEDAGRWVYDVERALSEADIVQPFDILYRLSPSQTEFSRRDHNGFPLYAAVGAAKLWQHGVRPGDCTGAAWAMNLDWFHRSGGLYDLSPVGGADTIMANALFGYDQPRYSPAIDAAVDDYTRKVRATRPRVGHVRAEVCHLWHGDLARRQYLDRHRLLVEHGFEPYRDLTGDADLPLEWATDKPALHAAVRDYFAGRREDLLT